MSSSSRRLRSVLLFLALLSAVVLGNAREAACEMHGLGAAVAHPVAVSHHGAEHSSSGSHQHQGQAGQECCCIDACSATVAVASAPVTPTLLVALVAAEPRRFFDERSAQTAPSEPERLLPFANGPPAGRLL